ncbi:hypothetical protein NA57DRAFT_78979 [Rhizodiscina lignyota]|uniref:Uncharacterized protein n=1 Tax=Rhizodiscina lignyota TaxID=1504668 RepID=A0A9P4IDG1_9PEZI|nr:hypothetical protein NA57DRAFT_78979 [Rhizodiscina lignyota]
MSHHTDGSPLDSASEGAADSNFDGGPGETPTDHHDDLPSDGAKYVAAAMSSIQDASDKIFFEAEELKLFDEAKNWCKARDSLLVAEVREAVQLLSMIDTEQCPIITRDILGQLRDLTRKFRDLSQVAEATIKGIETLMALSGVRGRMAFEETFIEEEEAAIETETDTEKRAEWEQIIQKVKAHREKLEKDGRELTVVLEQCMRDIRAALRRAA